MIHGIHYRLFAPTAKRFAIILIAKAVLLTSEQGVGFRRFSPQESRLCQMRRGLLRNRVEPVGSLSVLPRAKARNSMGNHGADR